MVAHEPLPLVEQPGHDGLYQSDPWLDRALATAFGSLDVVFVLGETARKTLTDTWRVSAPVVVIPHGNEDVFAAEPVPPAEDTEPCVLFFGTITAYKGLDDLLAAWPRIRAAVPGATLVVAGGVGADVDERRLREQVAGLAGARLEAGYVPMDRVPPLFASARVVVLPYRRASQSGVAHLAHTFARPVVATRVGDIPGVVRHERTGLLVPVGAHEELAEAVVRLLTDPEEAGRLGRAGRASLDESAGWDDVAAAVSRALT
jgi:glycosyltransferase involved in cell wall biosynthesis